MIDTAVLDQVSIPVSDLPPYEAAARLMGVLAYGDYKAGRDRFSDAICRVVLRRIAADNPGWEDTTQAVKPRHLFMDPERAKAEWEHGMLIINEQRLIAGKMASQKWANFVGDHSGRVFGPTSREMVAAVGVDLDERRGTNTEGNKGNIVSRAWTPSKPVLHLCLALHLTIHNIATDQRLLGVNSLFSEEGREIVRAVIGIAAAILPAAEQVYRIPRDQMVEVVAG